MKNAYLVDFFLSGVLLVMLLYLYVDGSRRIAVLNRLIDRNTLAIAIGEMMVKSVLFSLPLIAFLTFLLWRLYAAMLVTEVWGIGATGVLVVIAILGTLLSWLNILLACIKNSRFIDASKLLVAAKKKKKQAIPPPDTPLSKVNF